MWRIVASLFFSINVHASICDFNLNGLSTKVFHKKTIKEIMTPFEDSSDRVKITIKAVEESWLNYGRPDYLSAKSLGYLFTDHFTELTAAEKELYEVLHKIKYENEKVTAKNYAKSLIKDLHHFQTLKYIPPKDFQQWSMRTAALYGFIRTAKDRTPGSMRFQNIDYPSKSLDLYVDKATATLPIHLGNNLTWRELNDLWILNIAIIGLSRIDQYADGEVYEPVQFTVHDFSHAKDLDEKHKNLSGAELLKLIRRNLEIYKNFRSLQQNETDQRKKEIREAIAFTLLHEASVLLSQKSITDALNEYHNTIHIKFIEPYGFNEGFKPYVTKDEVEEEINWIKENWHQN